MPALWPRCCCRDVGHIMCYNRDKASQLGEFKQASITDSVSSSRTATLTRQESNTDSPSWPSRSRCLVSVVTLTRRTATLTVMAHHVAITVSL